MIPGSSTHSSGRGRPAKRLPASVQLVYLHPDNAMLIDYHNSSSRSKIVIKSNCHIPQHKDLLAVDTVNRYSTSEGYTRPCTMCSKPPSELAALAYELCLSSGLMQSFAAEACVAYDQPAVQLSDGRLLQVSSLPYDIVSLDPAGLVIEVQGEQHTGKDMAYTNTNENHGISSAELDQIKQQAACRSGYTTLWLVAGDQRNRANRWHKAMTKALLHVKAGLPIAHFYSP